MKILQSGEDYLETILVLHMKKGYVRSIDIADELGYSKPSVSRAMGILRRKEYVTVDSDGEIHLTESGAAKANQIYERHCVITQYLIETLGVSRETAEDDACRMEHVISQESFARIKAVVAGQPTDSDTPDGNPPE